MATRIVFDVFGRAMMVERSTHGWKLFDLGADGKRSPAEVPIPDFVAEEEIEQYLDDIYHEAATPRHTSVRRISSN